MFWIKIFQTLLQYCLSYIKIVCKCIINNKCEKNCEKIIKMQHETQHKKKAELINLRNHNCYHITYCFKLQLWFKECKNNNFYKYIKEENP